MQSLPDHAHENAVASVVADLSGRRREQESPDLRFYAASTMKVPVMIAVLRASEAGRLRLEDEIPVVTTFRSIVDGAPFRMTPGEIDDDLGGYEGTPLPVGDLIERMITVSSNEATNLLLERVGLPAVQAVVDDLGAANTVVARPIGDLQAADAGIQNVVTAADLVQIMTAIATGSAARADSCEQMTAILCRQRIRVGIPAALPDHVRSASKGGWVTRLRHDVAVVWPPGGEPYCQAVCTRGFDDDAALERIHHRARAAYEHATAGARR